MLKFHIDQLPDLRVSESRILDLSLEEEVLGQPETFLSEETAAEFRTIRGGISGTIGRDGTDVMVDVKIDYEMTLTCVRCLEEFERKGTTGERTLFFHEKNPSPEDLERYGSDGWINLAPWLRELVLTDFPFYPACRPDCLGLCPQCGENRNTGRCHCPS
jgi:uncharacterized protein